MSLDPLLIFYGYPGSINGSQTLEEARTHFSRYARVVLGDGLQDPLHPQNRFTRQLVESLPQVRFYGYVDLGVYTPHYAVQNLEISEVLARARRWKDLGVVGVLLDDYGYDFANTRERQCLAVQGLHDLGLGCVANSWDPRHALDSEPGPGNPKARATPLGKGDAYLYESYLVSRGNWIRFKEWRAKANTLMKLVAASAVEVWSCTTTQERAHNDGEGWDFVCACAWMDGHAAVGWGEPNFAASDNQACWRPLPELPLQRKRVGPRGQAGMQAQSDRGSFVIDYDNRSVRWEKSVPWWRQWLGRLK